jgi:hypothetical protein
MPKLSLPVLSRIMVSEAELLAGFVDGDDDPLSFLSSVPVEKAPQEAGTDPYEGLSDADVLRLHQRPRDRSECESGPRPCPWVGCRFNLYLDVRADGVMRVNFPDRDPDGMTASCSLDLASDGPRTLDQVATLMGMSRERARQIEEQAMSQLRRDYYPQDLLGDETDSDLDL